MALPVPVVGQDGSVREKTAEYLKAGSGSIFKSRMLDPDPFWLYLFLLWGEDGSVREEPSQYLKAGSGSIFTSIMLDPDPFWPYLFLLWVKDGSISKKTAEYLEADEPARGTRTGGVAQQPQHAAAERLRVQQAQQLHHRTHHLVPVFLKEPCHEIFPGAKYSSAGRESISLQHKTSETGIKESC